MDAITLTAGLLLPWLLGMAALAASRKRAPGVEAPGEVAWIAGSGYFVGLFALTLWMRALSYAGIRFGATSIALPLAIVTVALFALALRRDRAFVVTSIPHALRALAASPGLTGGVRRLWWLIIAVLAARFVLLALEVAWQPLYPWDAWIQWATKARVWYELGRIVPFARAPEWLAANGAMYFDASPEYPPTVPLLQVWASIALGHWDDALMNWPWWQIAVALTLSVYGALRRLGIAAAGSLVGAFLVASIPLANVHVALAGYADLPLAAFFTVAVLAFLCWSATRSLGDGAIAVVLLAACTQIKNPGLFWALTVVPGAVVALFPRRGLSFAGIAFGVAVMLLFVLAQTNVTIFLYRLHLDFDPGWQQLGESYFLMGNWNLLWYGVIGLALLLRRDLFAPPLAPFTTVIIGGLLFLFLVFGFTNAREWMAQQTTVNRATLHLAPLMAVYLVLAFHAFAARWTAAHAAAPVAATSASGVLAQGAAIPGAARPVAPAATPAATPAASPAASPAALPAASPAETPAATPATASATAAEFGATLAPASAAEAARTEPTRVAPPARAEVPIPVVGRNEPCPCGSGKRYKHCHGAPIDASAPPAAPSS